MVGLHAGLEQQLAADRRGPGELLIQVDRMDRLRARIGHNSRADAVLTEAAAHVVEEALVAITRSEGRLAED
jgi:hypothetical protein